MSNELFLQNTTRYEDIYCNFKFSDKDNKKIIIVESGYIDDTSGDELGELIEMSYYNMTKHQVKETIDYLTKIYEKMEKQNE